MNHFSKRHSLLWIAVLFILCFSALPARAAVSQKASDKADEIIASVITGDMSEKEKAQTLHDWLTHHAYYDFTYKWFTPDGVLLHHTGVCQSYAEAYRLLLSKVGIDCRILTGYGLNDNDDLVTHAWNLVKIDGKWYHVDVTWDDPADDTTGKQEVSGYENRVYFMASTAFILSNHTPDAESEDLIKELIGENAMSELPMAVKFKKSVAAPDFSFKNASGKTLTLKNYGRGKNLMIIYGLTTCGNTKAYLSAISQYTDLMKKAGVTVVLNILDTAKISELKKWNKEYPGVVCTMAGKGSDGLFEGLQRFHAENKDFVFPVIFLKNADDKLVYYSVNYVSDPLKLVSGAIRMAEQKSTVIGAGKYRLNKSKKTAVFTAPKSQKSTKLTIPASVASGGVSYKVTGIDSGACQGMTKLKKVTIGKNVTSIGKNAFSGCGKLKTIAVKTKLLKKAKVGAGAFSKISTKAVFTVPKSCKKTYKKIFQSRGASKKCTVK